MDKILHLIREDFQPHWFDQHAYVVAYNPETKKMEVHGMGSYVDFAGNESQGTEKMGDWSLDQREEFWNYLHKILDDDFILWCENPEAWLAKQRGEA